MGYEENHVHFVIEAAPKYSPSRIMQICKSILKIQIFKEFPKIKEEELWENSFGVMVSILILWEMEWDWNK